ncbi:hypothetical protein JTY60_02250 [symbiont of Argiope bruennichi]|uniref:hypothetical protein n=1 Tax=symbiont of Argiope bruennichi TaxID=2810479 RepID=UPI003DA3BEB6
MDGKKLFNRLPSIDSTFELNDYQFHKLRKIIEYFNAEQDELFYEYLQTKKIGNILKNIHISWPLSTISYKFLLRDNEKIPYFQVSTFPTIKDIDAVERVYQEIYDLNASLCDRMIDYYLPSNHISHITEETNEFIEYFLHKKDENDNNSILVTDNNGWKYYKNGILDKQIYFLDYGIFFITFQKNSSLGFYGNMVDNIENSNFISVDKKKIKFFLKDNLKVVIKKDHLRQEIEINCYKLSDIIKKIKIKKVLNYKNYRVDGLHYSAIKVYQRENMQWKIKNEYLQATYIKYKNNALARTNYIYNLSTPKKRIFKNSIVFDLKDLSFKKIAT